MIEGSDDQCGRFGDRFNAVFAQRGIAPPAVAILNLPVLAHPAQQSFDDGGFVRKASETTHGFVGGFAPSLDATFDLEDLPDIRPVVAEIAVEFIWQSISSRPPRPPPGSPPS